MNVGKSISVLCAKNHKTQKEIAAICGITTVYMSRLANKEGCSETMLRKLADAFQMSVSDFIKEGE